jgi:hypothetical protein
MTPEQQAKEEWWALHPLLPWEQLTATQRAGLVQQIRDAQQPLNEQGLRAKLHQANIKINVLELQLAAARECLAGHHKLVKNGSCIICKQACANLEGVQ